MGITYFGTYPASGSDQVVGTSLTTILSLAQQWNPIEDNFGVWDLEIQNNGARDITEIQFRHSIDNISYAAYLDISDAAAAAMVPLLAAGMKLKLRLFIPVGTLRVQAKSTAADGAVLTLFERSEVSYSEPIVNGTKLSTLIASSSSSSASSLGVASLPLKELFSTTHEKGLEPLFFRTAVVNAGTATHEDDLSAADLAVTIANTDSALLRSKERFKLQLGGEMVFKFEFLMGAGQENTQKCVGIFDDLDGFFFRQDDDAASILQFVMRTSTAGGAGVDTPVAQTAWNVDFLDGTGPSGKTLAIANVQQMYIRFAGQASYVEFGFLIDGIDCIAHRFYAGNGQALPLASWLSLPLSAYILNSGVAAAIDSLYVFSWFAGGYGDIKRNGVRISAPGSTTAIALAATGVSVMAVRSKDGGNYELGGVAPKGGTILSEAGARYRWRIIIGGTIVGGWGMLVTDLSSARSEVNYDNTAVTGGYVVASGIGMGQTQLPELELDEVLAAWPGINAAARPDNVALEITAIDAMNSFICFDVLELQ